MRIMEARTDFNFNGKWLHEFGGVLYNEGDVEEQEVLANTKHTSQELSLVDGNVYTGKKLEPFPFELNILFTREIDIDEIVEWLSVDEGGWLYYPNEERKIKCVLNGKVSISSYFRKGGYYGKLNIEMIAYEPHWYEIEPRYIQIQNPVKGQEYGFYNDGNLPSKPIIELKCVGEKTNFAIAFNNYEIEIDKFTQNIKIDSHYGTVTTYLDGKEINRYNGYKLMGGYHPREMIEAEPGKHNKFRIIRGEVTEIKVIPNIKWKS
ncbi:MAG: hypothetical protein ACRCX8_08555 [Sarcina sp.]